MDRQTNKQTDGRSNYYMPPADLSGKGHKNVKDVFGRHSPHVGNLLGIYMQYL